MGLKVATTCLHNWSQSPTPSSQTTTLASASRRRCHSGGSPALVFRYVQRSDRFSSAALFANSSSSTSRQLLFHRSVSSSSNSECYTNKQRRRRRRIVKRACTANFDAFSDEDFSRKIQELALRFQLSSSSSSNSDQQEEEEDNYDGQDHHHHEAETESESLVVVSDNSNDTSSSYMMMMMSSSNEDQQPLLLWESAAAGTQEEEEIMPAANMIERKANSVNLPVSLRIIQRKMQWQEGLREAGESAYCSVKRAFSSMVFIIQELQSFTLQMREVQLCYKDLQGILVRVQKEMHASFVWLFQQIFSHTPTLMVYVMVLLANFTVYSMSSNASASAIAAAAETTSIVQILDISQGKEQINKFDSSSSLKTYSISSSIGGGGVNNGGGGKVRPVASGNSDGGGDGQFQLSDKYGTILPDGASQLSSFSSSVVERDDEAEEVVVSLWKSIVDEAEKMQQDKAGSRLDHEARKRLVSPVTAKIEADDDYADYFRTELVYQSSLAHDPNNALLLANYAQFLFLVAQDYDRAEEYFKKSVAVKPTDAEAYNKYASFLWRVRSNLWAAEETYLEAISVEPTNSLYAANYANFLWNTGGDDTCFPLNQEE